MIIGWQLVALAGRIVACRRMPIPDAGNGGMLFERDRQQRGDDTRVNRP
jgi:hypothetical protein